MLETELLEPKDKQDEWVEDWQSDEQELQDASFSWSLLSSNLKQLNLIRT